MLKYSIHQVNSEIVSKLLKNHSTNRYKKLERYYLGDHDILHRSPSDPSKPDNRLVANFAQYISDLVTGYFIGQPITLHSSNEKLLTMIQDISNYNDQSSIESELALTASIKSKAYEMLYIDEEQNIRSAALQPENVVIVYNTSVNPEPSLAIYYYWETLLETDDSILNVEVYTATEKIIYRSQQVANTEGFHGLVEVERVPHYWGQVPIIEYNNPSERGDFERVITLIDAYNKVSSDSINNFEYFADAYMLLQGVQGTEPEDVRNMKENRVIPLGEGANASFLVKPSIESDIELTKNRLITDIHTFSSTPNLQDDAFSGSASGVALKYKLHGLEQYVALKERNFKKSIQRRLEMICHMLNIKGLGSYDYREIDMMFSRNLPQNLKELAEIVNLLKDQVPAELLLPLLPFVESADDLKALPTTNESDPTE